MNQLSDVAGVRQSRELVPHGVSSNAGPNRLLEILRRICLLVGCLTAAWLAAYPVDALFRVRIVDFSKLQKEKGRRMTADIQMMSRVSGKEIDPSDPTINAGPKLTLEQFIASETAGRLLEVKGQQWMRFYESVQQTQSGKSSTLAQQLSIGTGTYFLYFRPDAVPLAGLAGLFDDRKPFYFVVLHNGGTVKYLEVLFQRASYALHDAPHWLVYPHRQYAVWWFIVGLLSYALIPWYRKGPQELRYKTSRAMVIPDMLGAATTTFFFVAPIVIITANTASSRPLKLLDFGDGWGIVTIVLWLLALGMASITIVALWYSALSIVLRPNGIRRRTLLKADDYQFSEMISVEPAQWAWPAWLRIGAIFLGLFNWRLLGTVLLASSQKAVGMCIRCKDGRILKIWINHMPGFERIFRALKDGGVPLDPELSQAVEKDLTTAATDGPLKESSGMGLRVAAALLVAVAICGALTLHFWPEKTRKVEYHLTYSYEALAQRRQLTDEMQAIARQMQQATAVTKDSTPEQRAKAMQDFDALMKQQEELEKKYNAIQPTEEE